MPSSWTKVIAPFIVEERLRNRTLAIFLIIALCCAIYIPSLGHQFIWDDDMYVYDNSYVQDPGGLKDIWFAHETVQYYPVIFSLFWLEHKIWGLNPTGYRTVNLCFQIVNAILLLFLLEALKVPGAAVISLIFAVHPIQVETVAWITERKNLAAMFFFLLTFLAYLRFDRKRTLGAYGLTLLLFALGLLSKSITICFVTVPILYAWWREEKFSLREVKLTVPFLLLGAAAAVNTVYLELHKVNARGSAWDLDLVQRFLTCGRSFWFYVYKICVPFKFIFFYPRYVPEAANISDWIWPVLMIMVGILLYVFRKTLGRVAIVLYAFYFISLFPALGFINVFPFKYSFVADHFVYLSSPWLLTLLFLSARFVYMRFALARSVLPPKVLKGLLVFVVLFLSIKAGSLLPSYKNHISQWKTVIRKNPTSWAAYNNLGYYYTFSGKAREAIPLLKKGIELHPDDDDAYCNLSAAYITIGDMDQGIKAAQKSVELNPRNERAFSNLGAAYLHQEKYDEAVESFQKALEEKPGLVEAVNNLSTAYLRMGQEEKATEILEQAASKAPHYRTYYSLGNSYRKSGDVPKAIAAYEKAIKLNPSDIGTYVNLGNVLRESGDLLGAGKTFQAAITRGLSSSDLYNNFGVVLKQSGYPEQAAKAYQMAIKINPNYVQAYANLAYLFYDLGNVDRAVWAMEQAEEYGYTFDPEFVSKVRNYGAELK